jgi:hypothetical protein
VKEYKVLVTRKFFDEAIPTCFLIFSTLDKFFYLFYKKISIEKQKVNIQKKNEY